MIDMISSLCARLLPICEPPWDPSVTIEWKITGAMKCLRAFTWSVLYIGNWGWLNAPLHESISIHKHTRMLVCKHCYANVCAQANMTYMNVWMDAHIDNSSQRGLQACILVFWAQGDILQIYVIRYSCAERWETGKDYRRHTPAVDHARKEQEGAWCVSSGAGRGGGVLFGHECEKLGQ